MSVMGFASTPVKLGSYKLKAGTANADIPRSDLPLSDYRSSFFAVSLEALFGGRGNDLLRGYSGPHGPGGWNDSNSYSVNFLIGGEGDDTYEITDFSHSVIADIRGGYDTVNIKRGFSSISSIFFLKNSDNSTDLLLYGGAVRVLLIDPLGSINENNIIEKIVFMDREISVSDLYTIGTISNSYAGGTLDYSRAENLLNLKAGGLSMANMQELIETLKLNDNLVEKNTGSGKTGLITSSTPGFFQEGVTLTAPDVTGDPDGDAANPNYAYQWYNGGNAIINANTSTLAVPLTHPRLPDMFPAADAGYYVVHITYTDAQGLTETVRSPEQVISKFNNGNGTPASINSSTPGVFREGVTLSAALVTGDPDGDATNPNYAYQWFKGSTAITNATASTYAVPASGAGTYKVAVTYTDAQGFTATVDSPEQVITEINIPSYKITPTATLINEGATLTTSVATTNVAKDTTLYYSLSGRGITATDFSYGLLSGSEIVGADGKLSFSHTLANDLPIEGYEAVEIKIFSDGALTNQLCSTTSVYIADVDWGSITAWTGNSLLPTTTVSENLGIINFVPPSAGPRYYWSLTGEGVNEEDFLKSGSHSEKIVFSGIRGENFRGQNTGMSFQFRPDEKKENESITLKLFSDAEMLFLATAPLNIQILDSLATYSLNPSTSSLSEGSILTTVITTDVPHATTLYWSVAGTGITAADFSAGALTGEGTVGTDGSFSFFHALANDLTTEGSETLNIKLFTDSSRSTQVGSTASVLIADTSTTPTNTLKVKDSTGKEVEAVSSERKNSTLSQLTTKVPLKTEASKLLDRYKINDSTSSTPKKASDVNSSFIDFTIKTGALKALTAEIALDKEVKANAYVKVNPNTGEVFDFTYDPITGLGAELLDSNKNGLVDTLKIHLQDGAKGDVDGLINGEIRDPGVLADAPRQSVYRFFKASKGVHLYSSSEEERAIVNANPEWGYKDEGVAYDALVTQGKALHRFFNAKASYHFMTTNDEEAKTVKANPEWGFSYEGESFSVSTISQLGMSTPVNRFYRVLDGVGQHFYTASADEASNINAHPEWGYKSEGVGWYV